MEQQGRSGEGDEGDGEGEGPEWHQGPSSGEIGLPPVKHAITIKTLSHPLLPDTLSPPLPPGASAASTIQYNTFTHHT